MTDLAFLFMPLWQGSPSSRAMQLVEGAEVLREDLPSAATRFIEVPLEAGDTLGTPVARLSSIISAREAAREVIEGLPANTAPVTVGGDCSSALAGLEAALHRHGTEQVSVLWFDAHADMEHPSTSPSGAASGMVLRHALGDGCEDLRFSSPLPPERVSLIGARSLGGEEASETERLRMRMLSGSLGAPETPAAEAAQLVDEVRAALNSDGTTHLYVHVDLDVLDPAEFSAVAAPMPFGLGLAELTGAIRAATAELPLAGASISGFQPANRAHATEHIPTVLRVLGALSSGRRR
ncbi:arginase family protein [Leucobacter sp. GX24907]